MEAKKILKIPTLQNIWTALKMHKKFKFVIFKSGDNDLKENIMRMFV